MASVAAEPMREKALFEHVRSAARIGGWRLYHTFDSRRSGAGFPDLVLVHPRRKLLLFVELKRDGGKLSLDQADWFDALHVVGADVRVWRPSDLDEVIRYLVSR